MPELPCEMLQEIFRYLEYEELRACTQVSQHWRYSCLDDYVWKPFFEKYYLWFDDPLMEADTYFDEFIYFKDHVPKNLTATIDDFEYPTKFCTFSNSGDLFLVIGENAHFCLYKSEPLEFLHERTVETTLRWVDIRNASFSPNDQMMLLNGEKFDGTGEVAIFSIDENNEVHFVSRVPSNPVSFDACWFDEKHILIGELHKFDFNTPLGTSITQVWLCSVERITSESLLIPIVRFLNKAGVVCMPLITNRVSPRFRRIVQLSEQAKQEGKSLRDKVDELQLNANIDEGDVTELKQILDKEQECYHCYLKHILTEEEYGGRINCKCVCHNDTQKLLIYVCEKFANRVCFKVIDQKLITDALSLNRYGKKRNNEDEEEDRIENIMSQFDFQDYHIDFAGQIDFISLSPNQKSLYVSLENIDLNHENEEAGISHEIKIVDLEKMIIDPIGIRGRMKPLQRHFVTVNKSLIASFTQNKVFIWSKGHRGPSVRSIQIPTSITCTALHPKNNTLLVTSHSKVDVYTP